MTGSSSRRPPTSAPPTMRSTGRRSPPPPGWGFGRPSHRTGKPKFVYGSSRFRLTLKCQRRPLLGLELSSHLLELHDCELAVRTAGAPTSSGPSLIAPRSSAWSARSWPNSTTSGPKPVRPRTRNPGQSPRHPHHRPRTRGGIHHHHRPVSLTQDEGSRRPRTPPPRT